MSAFIAHSACDHVAFGDHVLNGRPQIRQRRARRPQPLLQPVRATGLLRHRVVVHELWRKKIVQHRLVTATDRRHQVPVGPRGSRRASGVTRHRLSVHPAGKSRGRPASISRSGDNFCDATWSHLLNGRLPESFCRGQSVSCTARSTLLRDCRDEDGTSAPRGRILASVLPGRDEGRGRTGVPPEAPPVRSEPSEQGQGRPSRQEAQGDQEHRGHRSHACARQRLTGSDARLAVRYQPTRRTSGPAAAGSCSS
jgi:hypothetical protein